MLVRLMLQDESTVENRHMVRESYLGLNFDRLVSKFADWLVGFLVESTFHVMVTGLVDRLHRGCGTATRPDGTIAPAARSKR